MKLRNKKTGEIVIVEYISDYQTDDGTEIGFRVKNTLNYYSYPTLAELNEEWEDYKPAEPLIKDEKIRKAVRAWSEANDIRYIHRKKKENDCLVGHDALGRTYKIEISPQKHNDIQMEDYKECYTIAELCGEEEE